jgi:hypothetical protein
MTLVGSFALTVAVLVSVSTATACGSGKLLFEDQFETLNPAWGFVLDPSTETVGGNGYVATFPPNSYRRGVSQLSYFSDYELCHTFKADFKCTDPNACESSPQAGAIFWGADKDNFYVFSVAPAYSTYSLSRLQNGKWLNPIGWTNLPAGKKLASGQAFTMGVQVKGSHAILMVDDLTVVEFDGLPPDGGSLIGFEVTTSSVDKSPSQMNLAKVTVHDLPTPP